MKQPQPIDSDTGGLMADITSILSDFKVAESTTALGDPSCDGAAPLPVKDIFAIRNRKAWDKTTEARWNYATRRTMVSVIMAKVTHGQNPYRDKVRPG